MRDLRIQAGEICHTLMKRENVNQRELGEVLSVHTSTINCIFNGTRRVSKTMYLLLFLLLNHPELFEELKRESEAIKQAER